MLRTLLLYCMLSLFAGKIQCQDIVSSAGAFISALTPEQRLQVLYPFDTDERYNFHFVPRDDRKGISMNELSTEQKQSALALIKTCLSSDCVKKIADIMQLDLVLKAMEHRAANDHYRDPGKYFMTIFGVPGDKNAWGWRLEGHHIAFNFSVKDKKLVAGTPGFMGSNPAIVMEGPEKGKQVLRDETEKGFALINTLSGDALRKAVIDSVAPKDIITFDNRTAMIYHPRGISYAEMTGVQQQQLLALVNTYVHRYTKLFADDMLKEIQRAGLANLVFAWAGNIRQEAGKPYYYRVQGPGILIEYDNTQNNANHVHSVIRDLKNDFGGDELLQHYRSAHR